MESGACLSVLSSCRKGVQNDPAPLQKPECKRSLLTQRLHAVLLTQGVNSRTKSDVHPLDLAHLLVKQFRAGTKKPPLGWFLLFAKFSATFNFDLPATIV